MTTQEERAIVLEKDVENLKQTVSHLSKKVDDLSDMKSVLVELKTITAHQVKRMDGYENAIQTLTETISSMKEDNSVTFSEITKYSLFTGLGVVLTALIGIILK